MDIILSFDMFLLSLLGAVIFRKDLINVLMCLEIMMIAIILNIGILHSLSSVVFVITLLTLAACETSIGLVFIINLFNLMEQQKIDIVNLKG